jgi:uncharacterized membrane protein YdjX (TVP38/TMEM64 family)
MSGLSERCPSGAGDGGDARDGDEAQEDSPDRLAQFAAAFCCIGICAGVGLSVIWYGPTKALRHMLNVLPKNPGWGWFIGLGVATAISIVMLMPIWPPLCMAAGLIFGIPWGAVLNFHSITAAAVISICLGRWVLREPIRRMLMEGEYPKVRRMMRVLEDSDNSLKFQILFRFLFVPMFIRNYGPATLCIPIWKLALGTLPHSAWISLLFASLGATFKDAAELIQDGKEVSFKDMKWQQGTILLVSLAVAIMLGFYAQRKYNEYLDSDEAKRLEEAGETQGPKATAT